MYQIIKNYLKDTITGRQNDGQILHYDNFNNTVFFYYFRQKKLYTYSTDII